MKILVTGQEWTGAEYEVTAESETEARAIADGFRDDGLYVETWTLDDNGYYDEEVELG